MNKKVFFLFISLFCLQSLALKAQEETVTNDLIIELLKEGFNSEEIIGHIENASNREVKSDLSSIRALKQNGANTDLITYIQQIAKTDFGYEGVYWYNAGGDKKVLKLYNTNFEQESKGGFGAIAGIATGVLIGGEAGLVTGSLLATGAVKSEKLVLRGAYARVVLTGENGTHPIFRFYFPKKSRDSFQTSSDSWFSSWMNDIQSPNEFQCIKMKQKKTKRTLPAGLKFTIGGFTSSTANKDIIDFQMKEINNNTFEVSFPNEIEKGEYCFFYKNMDNKWFGEHICAFDFSVQ